MSRFRGAAWVLGLALLGLACASGGGGGSSRNPNVIRPEELAEIPNGSAFEAVQRLRPRWLRTRGMSSPSAGADFAQVFIDNAPSGGPDALQRIVVQDIDSLVFMSASDATTRYGTGFTGGLIKVFTKGGR
ncbi:MAG: hypothetical protein R3E98_04320 [Gemmatimonadota bacterium]|nr:hypothetical protein [Gemmatimonadota bacterium]